MRTADGSDGEAIGSAEPEGPPQLREGLRWLDTQARRVVSGALRRLGKLAHRSYARVRQLWRRIRRMTLLEVVWLASLVATITLSVLSIDGWGAAVDFQWAGSGNRAVELLEQPRARAAAEDGLRWAKWLPFAYVVLAFTTGVLVWRRAEAMERRVVEPEVASSTSKRALTAVAIVAVLAAAGLDRYEDARTEAILEQFDRAKLSALAQPARTTPEPQAALDTKNQLSAAIDLEAHQVLAAAVAKWVLLLGAAAWLLYLLRQPLRPPPGRGRADVRARVARLRTDLADLDGAASWRPPAGDQPPRIGISCSGGGVRSAAFCLGALQRLDEPPPDGPSVLRRAEYLTAVSGGSYMASALAVAEWSGTWPEYDSRKVAYGRQGSSDGGADGTGIPAFAQGSPEESWFRRNSAYLASDAGEVTAGVMHTLAGLAINLIIIWLLLFVFARPVGWLLSSGAVHPELRAREPSVHVLDQPTLGAGRDEATRVLGVEQIDDDLWEFTFVVEPCSEDSCAGLVEVWRPTLGSDSEPERSLVRLEADPDRPGVGRVVDGEVEILRQPRLVVKDDDRIGTDVRETADSARDTITIDRQPRVVALGGVATDPAGTLDERIQAALRVSERPHIRQFSGTTGRPEVNVDGSDVFYGFLLLGIALLIYMIKIFHNPVGVVDEDHWVKPWSAVYSFLITATALAGVLMLAVFIVLPWCVQEVPPWVSSTFGHAPTAEPAAGTEQASGSAFVGLLAALGLSASSVVLTLSRKLTSKPMLAAKVFAVVLLIGVGFITTISLIQMAAANGPTGRLTGFSLGPEITRLPDYVKWLLAMALLGLMTLGDAHSWSMFPYYRRRLSRAFVLHRRADGTAEPLPYEIPVHFDRAVDADGPPDPAYSYLARARPSKAEDAGVWHGPELVVCAAANVIDEGVAPPGRRSVSFTFSGTAIGGPEVGWVRTADYLRHLSPRRQRDLTIPAAMAVSGAAVSPAMGKMGMGPLGRLLAVLNVRLGVWLPNPNWVRQMPDGQTWKGRPGWPWFLREVLGRHRADARYLYVSDGGHWENLGLVELFRRGCTEIYCLSAAGDGTASFGTLGEAIALAREELGVEVTIELEGLRAGTGEPTSPTAPIPVAFGPDPEPEPGTPTVSERPGRAARPTGVASTIRRTLRRKVDGAVGPVPTAVRAFAHGHFSYPPESPGGERVEGTLYVIEATLTDDLPWDVHAHAERWPDFPDDSTADQTFSHRQFESYRALGHHQVGRLLEWVAPGRQDAVRAPDGGP